MRREILQGRQAYQGGRPHAVGGKEPNEFGLCDMHGNVWEWVEDDWHSSYRGAPDDGRAWIGSPKRGADRVIRGGGWSDDADRCRSAFCNLNFAPRNRNDALSFRLSGSVP